MFRISKSYDLFPVGFFRQVFIFMPVYIQRRFLLEKRHYTETVDEALTYKEATVLCNDYKCNDSFSYYYVSRRPCNSWINKKNISFINN